MKFMPDAEVKRLGECEKGQLVRNLEARETDAFGILFGLVEGGPERLGIATLTDASQSFRLFDPEDRVLCYGGDLVWRVDPQSICEEDRGPDLGLSGLLHRDVRSWRLNVAVDDGPARRVNMQLTFPSSMLIMPVRGHRGTATFGRWQLFLVDEGDEAFEPVDVARFNAFM